MFRRISTATDYEVMKYKKICIVGPGAMGGMMAVMLERAGFEISALARPKKADAINKRGLTLLFGGETLKTSPKASADPADLGPQDLVIVTLKSNALISVAPLLAPLCKESTPIVTTMNGVPWWFFDHFGGALSGTPLKSVDPDGTLARVIPTQNLIWGVINCSVSELPDGTLEHTNAQHLVMGKADDDLAGVDEVAEVIRAGGYKCVLSDNIRREIWIKLLINVTMNPMSALAMAKVNEMFEEPLVRESIVAVADEARAVADKLGLELGPSRLERMKEAKVKTSMLQDLERGRALELGTIVEAVVEIAELTKVPVPLTKTLLGLMRLRAKTAGLS